MIFLKTFYQKMTGQASRGDQCRYRDRVDRYVRPQLGGYAVVALRRETIQLHMNSLFEAKFSRNSLINTLGLITSSLRYARRMGWIEISPADDIDIPRECLCTENRKKVREPIISPSLVRANGQNDSRFDGGEEGDNTEAAIIILMMTSLFYWS